MIKREQKLTTLFLKWASVNFRHTFAFEVKQTQDKSIPFSSLAPHQKRALMIAKHGFFKWKIPDAGYQNPFDGFCLYKTEAYVVVFFGSNFYIIDIDIWIHEQAISKRRSLTSKRAIEIAQKVIHTPI